MPRTSTVHAVTAIGIDMGKNTLHMVGLDSHGAYDRRMLPFAYFLEHAVAEQTTRKRRGSPSLGRPRVFLRLCRNIVAFRFPGRLKRPKIKRRQDRLQARDGNYGDLDLPLRKPFGSLIANL